MLYMRLYWIISTNTSTQPVGKVKPRKPTKKGGFVVQCLHGEIYAKNYIR